MLYVQHWSFKAGYHQKGAEKFLAGGGDYPGVEMIGRYHAPGSLEGWIVLKTDDPKAIYQHAAEWGEFLNWETTPVFTDEEAGPIVAKVYSQLAIEIQTNIRVNQHLFMLFLISYKFTDANAQDKGSKMLKEQYDKGASTKQPRG